MTIRVTKVKPRSGHRIWLLYSAGVSGVVDLSDLTGKGVFQAWDQPGVFDRVHVAPHGAVAARARVIPGQFAIGLPGSFRWRTGPSSRCLTMTDNADRP